jgi:flagellar biosynthesis protein FlhA
VNILTEYVRQGLKRQISKLMFPAGQGRVVTIDQGLDSHLMESIQQSDAGSYLSIDPVTSQSMMNSLAAQIQKLVSLGEQPVVVTAPIVRFYFKKITEQIIPDLIVLSYNEIEADIEIQSIGMVNI